MIGTGRVLGLVTARGGSKRVPSKNLRSVGGFPLIRWSIAAAERSRTVDRIVVSTDDHDIATVAKNSGAAVPFLRPDELSTDSASSLDVVEHAILTLREHGDSFDYVVLLQPTSPLRTATHIDGAAQLLAEKNAKSVVSVCSLEHPIEWTGVLPDDLGMSNFFDIKSCADNTSETAKRYRLNGAIFLISVADFLESRSFYFGSDTFAFVMDQEYSLDIDTEYDITIADMILSNGG